MIPFSSARAFLAGLILVLLTSFAGCTRPYAVVPHRHTEPAHHAAPGLSWFGPELAADIADLAAWRKAVGPPLIVAAASPPPLADRLVVVNWNVHVGAGDVARLVQEVRLEHGDLPLVLLLQETYRNGLAVSRGAGWRFASAIGHGDRQSVEEIAEELGLHAYYVPSMRNGNPLTSGEDRGNAILSTAPLREFRAIELPFESQRRVAIAATLAGTATDGTDWSLRVVSAHLDNLAGARRLWIAGSEAARARQARGLLAALDGAEPTVLGADLNTWFGFGDAAYREVAPAFPDTRVTDRRATFMGLLRLDHLFFRLPEGASATFERADDDYGSDHHPLVATVELRASPGRPDGPSLP